MARRDRRSPSGDRPDLRPFATKGPVIQSRHIDSPRASEGAGSYFWYEFSDRALRIGIGGLLLRAAPYWRIERVERGWAPGLQLGGPGMPERGDEVRIRSSEPLGFPWLSLTPPDPDGFVQRLADRLARAVEDEPPARAGVAA